MSNIPGGRGAVGNQSFSKVLPTYQFAWDSTSLGLLKECPRKYYYTNVLGKERSDSSVHLVFGSHYHRAHEIFHHARSAGAGHTEALHAAVRYCLEATWDRTLGRGWISDIPEKNRLTLVRSIVWYYEQFAEDPLETVILASGKPAVELSFKAEVGEAPTGDPLLLCGHLDRVATIGGDTWISDYKTSKGALGSYYFQQFSPHNQFSLYTFASEFVYSLPVKGIVVDAAQVGAGFSRFQRGFVTRTAEHHEEWFKDFKHYTTLAYQYAAEGYWPLNDKSCGSYGGCPFQPICSKPPSVREQWLGGYANRQWDPMVSRGQEF